MLGWTWGRCLVRSSSGCAQQSEHPERDPQQPGEVTGPTELNSPAVEGLEGVGSQAAATEVPVSIGEPGMEM